MRDLDFLKLQLFVLHNTDTTVSFPLSSSHFFRYHKQFTKGGNDETREKSEDTVMFFVQMEEVICVIWAMSFVTKLSPSGKAAVNTPNMMQVNKVALEVEKESDAGQKDSFTMEIVNNFQDSFTISKTPVRNPSLLGRNPSTSVRNPSFLGRNGPLKRRYT